MEGVDLVTEGTLTLARVAKMLEGGNSGEPGRWNPATDLFPLMLQSDIVQFMGGTGINEAHEDPTNRLEFV